MPATLEEEQRKARSRPVTGPHDGLARETRRLLGWDGEREFLTARMAAQRAHISHATVATMARGDQVADGSLMKFARALGGDPALLLRLAGYPPSRYLSRREATGSSALPPDSDESDLLALYRALPPQGRRLLRALAEDVQDFFLSDSAGD